MGLLEVTEAYFMTRRVTVTFVVAVIYFMTPQVTDLCGWFD